MVLFTCAIYFSRSWTPFSLFICLTIRVSDYLSICLPFCLSTFLFLCLSLSAHLFVSPSLSRRKNEVYVFFFSWVINSYTHRLVYRRLLLPPAWIATVALYGKLPRLWQQRKHHVHETGLYGINASFHSWPDLPFFHAQSCHKIVYIKLFHTPIRN